MARKNIPRTFPTPAPSRANEVVRLREAEPVDLPAVTDLDARITGERKADYWRSMLERYGGGGPDRSFLVAETAEGKLAGFIAGEVRAWEFGARPCGWVFAIQVDPALRLGGVATALFQALCARFKAQGVRSVRTLVDRKDLQILSFFRSQGLRAGPSLQLEAPLE